MGGSLSHGVDTCCEKVSPYQGSHFLTGISFSRNTCMFVFQIIINNGIDLYCSTYYQSWRIQGSKDGDRGALFESLGRGVK